MKKTLEVDVAVMEAALPEWAQPINWQTQGGLKIAVFEKYPAQGGAVSNCPMCFCSTPDTPEAQKRAFEVLARFSNYTANLGLVSRVVKYSSELPRIVLDECKIESPLCVKRPPEDYGNQRGYTMGHANGLDVGDIIFSTAADRGHAFALVMLRMRFMLEKKGVQFYWSTPIKKIIRDENSGKVTGAIACEKDGTEIEIKCKALIVASAELPGISP